MNIDFPPKKLMVDSFRGKIILVDKHNFKKSPQQIHEERERYPDLKSITKYVYIYVKILKIISITNYLIRK